MRRGIRVSGTVTDEKGAPLSGIEVFALDELGNRASSATSVTGAFSVVVTPGSWRFTAVDPLRRYVASQPSEAIVVVEGETPPAVALTLTSISRRRAVRH